jgi:type 1 glutamine amidotransferase
VPSVGSVGDGYDNALAETINGLYKAEVIWRQRSWPSASSVEMATLRWVDWFNNHRLFGPIGYIPPAEAEANYYAALENLDMVASPKPNGLRETRDASDRIMTMKRRQFLSSTTPAVAVVALTRAQASAKPKRAIKKKAGEVGHEPIIAKAVRTIVSGLIGLVGLTAVLSACPASASPIDCPLAHTPYSSRTPLIDVLIDPRAKAVLDRVTPRLTEDFMKPFGGRPMSSGFAAILSPAILLKSRSDAETLTTALDRDLATIPITWAATRARCARYDEMRPKLPMTIKRPALLVFDKINGFRDQAAMDAAASALRGIALGHGWSIVFSDKGAVFNARDLARFDAVVWNNVSGDALTIPEQNAFKSWMMRTGGFAGIHGAGGDFLYLWDWYADTLIGARFEGHPMAPQFQAARVVVADRNSSLTAALPAEWTMTEEWYSFEHSPRLGGAHILATIDEASYHAIGAGGQDLHMGDHPIIWTRCIGNGRSFYTAIGHRPENYTEPYSLKLLEQGIAWAMGKGDTRCVGVRETRGE